MSNIKHTCSPKRLVVRKIETDTRETLTRTAGGILKEKKGASIECKAIVLVVGSEIDWVKPGDIIVHGHHSGTVFISSDFLDSLPEEKRKKSAEQKLEEITRNQNPIIDPFKENGIGEEEETEALLSLNDYEVLLVSSLAD